MDLTMALKSSKDVEFQDVYYTIVERKNFVQEVRKRNILNGVSGIFRNGQLSAIIGPSGAGKSSLLNAISGYRTSGVSGLIRINRHDSCYITQEEHHQPLLTVEELMHVACSLKLKHKKSFNNIISDILENLNINHRRNITPDKLSGGERKRLSIALELVANPTIFFLDEPTSGLDEVSAASCIRLLKNLAKQGRTIVCTIHQPSPTTFNLFDNVFALAKGYCVYQGQPEALIPFLSHVTLDCPTSYSPSDYVIEVCDFDGGQNVPILAEVTQNGKLKCEVSNENNFHDGKQLEENNYKCVFKNALVTLHMEMPKTTTSSGLFGGSAILKRMKAISKKMKGETYPISSFKQFSVLLRLMLLKIFRNKIVLWIQLVHHIMCGVMIGIIFFGAANQGERMFDHLKFCIGCILVIVYTQVMVPILSYPNEVKLVKKEFFNRWYSLTPYYMALTISRIPLQFALNTLFLTCVYWMPGLPNQLWRFMLFTLIGLIISLVAEGMGLAIGATFKVTNGTAVGPLLIAPFLGLAIYGFDFAADIPVFIYVIMKFSYIRVGAVTMVLTIFGFNREDLDCNDIYCHFKDPKVLLRFLRVENVSIWHEIGFLILLLLFFRVLLFISLKKRCKT